MRSAWIQCWLARPRSVSRADAEFLARDAGLAVGGRQLHAVRVADAAVAHDDDAVGQGDGFVDVVGDEQHGGVMPAAQLREPGRACAAG